MKKQYRDLIEKISSDIEIENKIIDGLDNLFNGSSPFFDYTYKIDMIEGTNIGRIEFSKGKFWVGSGYMDRSALLFCCYSVFKNIGLGEIGTMLILAKDENMEHPARGYVECINTTYTIIEGGGANEIK